MQVAIGGISVDTDAHEIRRAGRTVRVSPKAFELLSLLLARRPHAVSRSELQERLWPDTFVVEKNLTNLISELREALGDDAGEPRFIRTIHRIGYAFQPAEAQRPATPDIERGTTLTVSWNGGRVTLQRGEHVIGRDPQAAICLDDPGVSRRHAVIQIDADGATLQDCGSKNGTAINRGRVQASACLVDDDRVRVGSIVLTVRLIAPTNSTQTLSNSLASSE
jgi:DNA-binding winged helix-turn-helix (wHTH) protein